MYLGFDTSNYTTSVALFDGNDIIQAKKLLHVKTGERGLRQSDAVFSIQSICLKFWLNLNMTSQVLMPLQ